MRRIASAFAAALFAFSGWGAPAQDLSGYEAEAETVLQRLRGEMMREMKRAMAIGAEEALDVCRHLAPDIEAAIEKESGWEVRRTSLKPRNPANAPDEIERGMLLSFELRGVAGQTPETMRSLRIVEKDGATQVHFMQATPVFETCLACHGETISPEVSRKIATLFPDDQAVGYKVGDIRGAFSLYKPLGGASPPPVSGPQAATPDLPSEATLRQTGVKVDPRRGKELFDGYCKSCHGAADLAEHLFSAPEPDTEKIACRLLETHGRTGKQEDCDILGYLQAIAPASR